MSIVIGKSKRKKNGDPEEYKTDNGDRPYRTRRCRFSKDTTENFRRFYCDNISVEETMRRSFTVVAKWFNRI